jgi:glucose dehydrogenase
VAIDAKTGKYRWHFQEVHHDLWDFDAPSPVVLFDVRVKGQLVHAVGQPGKTGWLYLLNRETGKPLYGIPERPVPQSSVLHTSPTQPIPNSGAFVPHSVSAAALKGARQAAIGTLGEARASKIVPGTTFTPPARAGDTIHATTPGALGGDDWAPSSYNPNTQMFYVCAQTGSQVLLSGTNEPAHPKPGQQDVGSAATLGGASTGVLAAIDARSGRVAWEHHWPDPCYSGTVTTAGNLVFAGRNGGQLQAFDARNGKLLWSFQTGAGANSTTTEFDLGGKEVVAFYAAGSALAGDAHGDNLWLFGLDGTLGPVAAAKQSAAQAHAGESTAASTIHVQGGEFFFKLSSQTAKVGKDTFVFKNVGHVGHDFTIAGKGTPVINPGQTATLTVNFTKPGNYPYLCTVPGHAAAGMKGVLKVG